MCTVSGVLADGIQCIGMNGVLFPGDQVVKSCSQDGCVTYSVNVFGMATSWSGGYGGALHTKDIYHSIHHTPYTRVGLGTKPK